MSKYMNLVILDLLLGGALISYGMFDKGVAGVHTSVLYWIGMGILISSVYPMKKMREAPAQAQPAKEKKKADAGKKKDSKPAPPVTSVSLGSNETKIDGLYKLISQNQKVKVNDAPKLLGVDKKTIEEWADVLQSHGLIEIHYPTFGATVYTIRTKKE